MASSRWIAMLAMVLWVMLPVGADAATDKRVALVIGNGAYVNVAKLSNPPNDARLIAETLKGLGFTLVGGKVQQDLDKARFDQAVQSFGAQIQGADVALFYYAGHGMQVDGGNYLVPVGANPARRQDLDFQMVDAQLVLRQMEGSGTKLNVMILDACRNNPFGARGLRAADGGLAQMKAPEGTLIAYATQPGNVALDGADGNSPFSKALAETIRTPGLDVFHAFNQIGLSVKRATGGAQQPWISSSPIDGDFYFAPGKANAAAPQVANLPDPAVKPAESVERGNIPVLPKQQSHSTIYWLQAADNGDAEAQYRVGLMTELGNNGVPKDTERALALYRKAAAQGYPDACVKLGWILTSGTLAPQDFPQAMTLFRKAADAGLPGGMEGVATLYERGAGVPKDEVQALDWHRKAADLGNAAAQTRVGFYHHRGRGGLTPDGAQALAWYTKAGDQGDAGAWAGLGGLYLEGFGVPRDYAKAESWFRKAALEGNGPGEAGLGRLYEEGWGLPKDEAQAVYWYSRAATDNFPPAQLALGIAYLKGKGVPRDRDLAREWLRKAAAQGQPKAKEVLDKLGG